MDHLVAYGTLQSSYPTLARLGLAAAVRPAGRCRFRGTIRDLGPYPGFVLDGGGDCHGELLAVLEPRAWAVLDRFEGAEYRRLRITCVEPAGAEAWIYEMVVPAGEPVAGGVWRST